MMTQDQRKHLNGLVDFFENRIRNKYECGAEEHDGDLFNMAAEQLCLEAIDEALDQITYLYTLYQKIMEAK